MNGVVPFPADVRDSVELLKIVQGKILAILLGMYHALMDPYFPMRSVVTAPALQLILIPFAHFLTSYTYFLLLNTVTVEHLSRYALLSGKFAPCASKTSMK